MLLTSLGGRRFVLIIFLRPKKTVKAERTITSTIEIESTMGNWRPDGLDTKTMDSS